MAVASAQVEVHAACKAQVDMVVVPIKKQHVVLILPTVVPMGTGVIYPIVLEKLKSRR